MKKSWLEPPLESPIPFSTGSNGEFVPAEPSPSAQQAEVLFRRVVDENSRRLGVSRRQFIESACGSAAALLVINSVAGCGGKSGNGFKVDAASAIDSAKACAELSGTEFIFDVQTHHVNPEGSWRNGGWDFFFQSLPQGACGESDATDCFNRVHYLREMFINSDTAVAVLSAVPAEPGANPLEVEEAAQTREIMNMLAGSQRLAIHGLVLPDRGQGQIDGMQRLAEEMKISAWKTYTPYGSWWLSDAPGRAMIEKARSLGIKRICAHKGLPLFNFDPTYASPEDVGVVAADYPDVNFIIYHSGYETDITEGPYDPANPNPQGIDRLIKSLDDNGIGPNANVWAELGSAWRAVMSRPNEAAHVVGKLLRYVGEDRVLWGTDSIWYGTPQDQIQAFRSFQISTQFQEAYGYPELTPALKAKVFGLNAATAYGIDVDATRCAISEDDLATVQASLDPAQRLPRYRKYGPQTRREFLTFLRRRDGMPG